MNSPADEPRPVTPVSPAPDGTITLPPHDLSTETVAATPEQQRHSAELSAYGHADLIAGRYHLTGELGRGGMGVIHSARDVKLNRDVAVKLLLDRYPADSNTARRFVEEAQIAGQLQHPGIAPVHDLGTLSNGRPFLAMKLIKGQTLLEILASRERKRPEGSSNPNPPVAYAPGSPNLIDTFTEIAQTIAYVHCKGVIHRDLKPANVMVGAFGEVQVMDWGLAKVIRSTEFGMRNEEPKSEIDDVVKSHIETCRTPDTATLAGSVMGTPAYMPPEQATGDVDRTDARSDVFALGAILCELLTGQPPYVGTFDEVRALSITGETKPALDRLAASGADVELIDLTTRCLAADPRDRPADGAAVASALNAYRTGVADRLRRAERDKAAAEVRIAEQLKRRRVWLALAALLVIGTATSVVLAIKSARNADRADREAVVIQELRDQVQENFDAAYAAFQMQDSVIADTLGKGHPAAVDSRLKLASVLAKNGEFEKAEESLKKAHEKLKQSYGTDHTLVQKLQTGLDEAQRARARKMRPVRP